MCWINLTNFLLANFLPCDARNTFIDKCLYINYQRKAIYVALSHSFLSRARRKRDKKDRQISVSCHESVNKIKLDENNFRREWYNDPSPSWTFLNYLTRLIQFWVAGRCWLNKVIVNLSQSEHRQIHLPSSAPAPF